MRILGVSGSTREHSHSLVLMNVVLEAARAAGGETTVLNLLETPLPLFRADGSYDREHPEIERVRALTRDADAYVLVSPEYHGSMSGWMKNYFDFHYYEFGGKLFGLVASTGGSLGESCLSHMRAAVQYCHGWSLPYHSAARSADFDASLEIKAEKIRDRLRFMGRDLVEYGQLLGRQFQSDVNLKSSPGNESINSGFAAWHVKTP
mgnify:CR=1 FL=1